MKKIKLKILACSFEVRYLPILKILSVTRFKDPKAAILTLKMLIGFCDSVIVPKAAGDKLILAHFPCSL
jgi:hypothetical protein